jgi:hypothetical protein
MLSVGISPWMSALRRGASPFVLTTLAGGSALPEWLSHSRASGAMMFDSTGKLTWAPENLVTYSEDFSQAIWSKLGSGTGTAPTVTTGFQGPELGMSACRVQLARGVGGTSSDYSLIRVLNTAQVGVAHFNSIWLKSNDSSTYKVQFYASELAQSISIDVTPVWQRFSVKSLNITTNKAIGVYIIGSVPTTSQTADILMSGAQQERVTTQSEPSVYKPTTSAAYYGPRFDYDPATLTALGLLLEGTRTNDVDNLQAWSTANVTRTASAAVAPTGVTEAYKIEAATTAGTTFNRTVSAAGSTANTYSIFIKKGSGATDANKFAIYNNSTTTELLRVSVDFDAGTLAYIVGSTGATLTPVGNGWYRLTMTVTSGVSTGNALIVYCGFIGAAETAGEYLYAFGPQLEKAAFASSYIWTTTAAATRASDVCQIIGAGLVPFQSNYGWAAVQMRAVGLESASVAFVAGSSSNNYYLFSNAGSGKMLTFNGSVALDTGINVLSSFMRGIFTWNKVTPGRRLQGTGGVLKSDSNNPTIGATTQWLGSIGGVSAFAFFHLQSIALGIGNPSDAELASKLTVDGSY